MNLKECEICGCYYRVRTLGQKYCSSCNEELFRSYKNEQKARQPHKNPNQKLMDEVRAAAKAGLTYGNYKGREL